MAESSAAVAAPRVSIEVVGARHAADAILEVGARAADVIPVSEAIRKIVLESNRRRFETDGLGTWAPLASSTLDSKARAGEPDTPLVATGALYRSLTDELADDQIDERAPQELRFGTKVPYAVFHGSGTRTMPQREPVLLLPSERNSIRELCEVYVAKGLP